MTLPTRMLSIALLSSAALWPALAHAEEVPPAVQAFLANIARQTEAKPAYDAIKSEGSNVTITNLSLAKEAKGDTPGLTVKTGTVTLSGITDQGGSLWQVDKASFSDTSVELKGKDVSLAATIPAASAQGWYIRAVPAAPTPKDELLSSATFAKQMTSGPITLTAMGQTVKIDSIDTTWTGDPATGAGKFQLKVNNLAIPDSLLAVSGEGAILKQIGYNGLNLDLASSGDLTMKGDTLDYVFDLSLAGRDMGALSVNASVGDLPVAAYAEMLKSQGEGKGIDFDKLAPQLQNVQVNGASLSFTDNSIVKKLLPVVAAMQGMDEKMLIASIPPSLQLTLIQLQNEALTKQAVDAVTKFLADPKSLTLSVKPTAPMKVSDFSALDPTKPGDAITKLGVSVTANE